MTKICFIDTETTSLRPDRRAWEIGLIIRDTGQTDEELTWYVDLGNADLKSLQVGRFHDRHPDMGDDGRRFVEQSGPEAVVMTELEYVTRDAILVGATIAFDADILAARMRDCGICPSWHYRLFDVTTFAAGALRKPPPGSLDTMLAAFDVKVVDEDRHTALGDARLVRDLYDAVLGANVVDAEIIEDDRG